ncbi:putative glycolipid-binding domain-containing protein [Roseobacteraceae bacterium NS-SX3]
METAVRWCSWQREGLEHCVLRENADGLVLEGIVTGPGGASFGAHYFVRTDAQMRTREVRVEYAGGPRLHVAADGMGHWQDMAGGAAIPALDGCLDVDIGVTPATNTLPVRRLCLAAGDSAEILAAFVPPPDAIEGAFLPRPARQRYTCLTRGSRYRYEGLDSGFQAELEVDANALVLDYPGVFRRAG